jgi:hypothetical protein
MFSWHPLKSTDASKFARGFKTLENPELDDEWRMEYLERAITKHCWSPILLRGGNRLEKNFLGSYICALDFDAPYTPLACAIEEFKDFSHIIATTKSHQKPKNGVVCDRYRVVLWWERLITDLAEYKYNLAKQIDNYYSDKACSDGARFFFPCVDIISSNGNGKLVPVDALDVAPQKIVKHHTRQKPSYFGIRDTPAPVGTRNKAVFAASCEMLRRGMDIRMNMETLRSIANGLQEREIEQAISSAEKTEGNSPQRMERSGSETSKHRRQY